MYLQTKQNHAKSLVVVVKLTEANPANWLVMMGFGKK